jgi:predicted CoA-binding protein
MKPTKQNISAFFEQKSIAVVGASGKSRKFGNDVIKELCDRNFKVFVVHPSENQIAERKCFKSISDLPVEVGSVLISVNKNKTNDVVIAAKQKGIKNIWVQQMSDNEQTTAYADGCNLIVKQCIMMHMDPVKGGHKFHRGIKKLFGLLPK